MLSDGVVTLRASEERDLVAIEQGIHDPEVIRAFGRATLSAEDALQLSRDRWRRGAAATFAICDDTDRCLGHVVVNVATRALRLVSHWAFHDLGRTRVGLLTEPSNEAPLRVAERSGFQREGLLRSYGEIDGRRVDYISFSLLEGDTAVSGSGAASVCRSPRRPDT